MYSNKSMVFNKYPWVGRTLDVMCGDGQRVKIGRDRGHNVWGLEERDYNPSWGLMGIDHYVKRGSYSQIPYPDNAFDFVTTPNPIVMPKAFQTFSYTALWYEIALGELHRVGRKDYFLKIPNLEIFSRKYWLKLLEDIGYNVIVFNRSLQGNYLVEATRNEDT